jgi:GNAT superfamily N-acetyltransferase
MIRPATTDDVPVLQMMIRELAAREDSTDLVVTAEDELRSVLSGPDPLAFAHIAVDEQTGQVVGYTLWCLVYSTWRGTAVHIDDIYVRPQAAGRGYETALLSELARICSERGYRHMEWWGLTSNTPAVAYYESLGAGYDPDMAVFRINAEPLAGLAAHG